MSSQHPVLCNYHIHFCSVLPQARVEVNMNVQPPAIESGSIAEYNIHVDRTELTDLQSPSQPNPQTVSQ